LRHEDGRADKYYDGNIAFQNSFAKALNREDQ
jgi:hypothetical protein